MRGKENGRAAMWAVLTAVAVVAAVSLLPLERLSGGFLSDFNLVADIIEPDSAAMEVEQPEVSGVTVDAALARAMEEAAKPAERDSAGFSADESAADSLPESAAAGRTPEGVLPIEDYSPGSDGLRHLRAAIAAGKHCRIAFAGDSYIEGDIFTQDVRALLQEEYGGSGVGYMNMQSEFPGFRRSVRQSGKGWTAHLPGEKGFVSAYEWLAECYFTNSGSAVAEYAGANKIPRTDSWTVSRYLFIAGRDCSIVTVADGAETSHAVEGGEGVQQILVSGTQTRKFAVKTDGQDIISLGVWLETNEGIGVDCMSSRGFSGLTLAGVDGGICAEMRRFVDYDLIVLEFGINAISAGQKSFNVYCDKMTEVVKHLRNCYPESDFMIMGVGDRGTKKGGTVHSAVSMQFMTEAQRLCARRCGVLFWDTRAAMGGEDAIVDWTSRGLANKDYIHLNHKGGAELAREFVNALNLCLR